MSLGEQLANLREASAKRMPPDKRAIMQRATADLRASGIMDRVLKVGGRMPDFSLPNASGRTVSSVELLQRGPIVITVFRGGW